MSPVATEKSMKKLLLLLVLGFGVFTSQAQTRQDSDGNTVYHPFFAVAQYQMGDFDMAKYTSSYGLGLMMTSISHWGVVHVGANVNFGINAGIIDDWGCIIDFGPSVRVDISKSCFINMPINATCGVTFPEGTTDTETAWGAKLAPAIHLFATNRLGVFAGPQFTFGDGGSSVGMVAGISYSF